MWTGHSAVISLSGSNWYLAVRRFSMQICWISRGDLMVNNSIHIHVDISWSLSCRSETVTLWNCPNENTVSNVDLDVVLCSYTNTQCDKITATIYTIFSLYLRRCQCWMAFTWISSMMLCCPPLLGYSKPIFDKEAYICKLDWGNMAAYSGTLAILVLGPSVISIVYNYGYIFVMMRRLKSGAPIHDKEYATALAENLANPSHMMSFALVFSFWVSWAPFIIVRLYELIFNTQIDIPMLHFAIVWLGVMNSFWKILIMMSMSPQFRLHLRVFCLTICCKTKGRLQAELIGLDPDD